MVGVRLVPHRFDAFWNVDERVVVVGVDEGYRWLIFVVVVFLLGLWLVLNIKSWYNGEEMIVNGMEGVVEEGKENVESWINEFCLVVGLRCWMKWDELL